MLQNDNKRTRGGGGELHPIQLNEEAKRIGRGEQAEGQQLKA